MTSSQVSGNVIISSGAAAGAYGVYQQMIAGTSFDAKWLYFGLDNGRGVGFQDDVEISIATGAGGSEIDDYADVYFRNPGNSTRNTAVYQMPINIPSGSRIAIRIKDSRAAVVQYDLSLVVTDDSMPLGSPVTMQTLSPVTMQSNADGINYGGWIQLSAALSSKADYMFLYQEEISPIATLAHFDIGTGAGGSEVARISELPGDLTPIPIRMMSSMMWNGPITLDNGVRVACRVKDVDLSILDYRCGMVLLGY